MLHATEKQALVYAGSTRAVKCKDGTICHCDDSLWSLLHFACWRNKLSGLVYLALLRILKSNPISHHSQLHAQVCEALQADPVQIPAMAAALRYIGIGLTKEIGKIREEASHSLPIALKAAPIKPFYDHSLQHLSDLSGAIDHRGPPGLTTYDREEAQV